MTDTQDLKRYKYGYSSDEWGMGRSLGLIPDHAGNVCLFSDAHDKLESAQAEIERLQTAVKHLSGAAAKATFAEKIALARLAESQAEVEKLRAQWKQFEEYDCDELKAANALIDKLTARLAELERQESCTASTVADGSIAAAGAVRHSLESSVYECPKECGCWWRDNHDGTMSLFDDQKSCNYCEPLPLHKLKPLRIEDHLIIEMRHDGKWLVCINSEIHDSPDQAQKALRRWQAAGASTVQPSQGLQSVADALTIEQLNDKVERLQEENAKLMTALAECRDAFPVPDAGADLDGWYVSAIADPLEVPEYVKAAVESLKDSRDFYKRRVDLLQQWQSKMRDPERTICCDIIANGQTLPPENAGNRYAVRPVYPSNEEFETLWLESHKGHPADFAADVLERWGGAPAGLMGHGGKLAQQRMAPVQPSQAGLSDADVWANEEIMALNAEAGLEMSLLMKIVRAAINAKGVK